jgi:predicted phage gp36 major capsid-like protein
MGETVEDKVRDASRDELVDELRDRVRRLEQDLDTRTEELREHRRIIAALTSRIPQLEAPQEPRDARETPSEDGGTETPAGDTGEPRRSWWRRFFGFE